MKTSKISQLEQTRIAELEAKNAYLQQQLDWFKRQLFGRKSEKQLIDNPHQTTFLVNEVAAPAQPDTTEVKSHKRKSNTQRSGDEVNDTGLRFDDSVPQHIIELPAPELQGDDADQYEIIDYKETTRLAPNTKDRHCKKK